MQTNIKKWLIVGNVECLSEASVYKDATSTVHAIHPSLRGTFLYWMQPVTSTVDVPYREQNKPWLSPVFPSYFPTLHTADNSSWAVFTYLPAQKKKFFTFTESKCSQNPSLRFIVSQFWPSHEDWQTDWFCTRPRPSGLVSFSFKLRVLVSSSHGGHRIPISRREADSHLIGFAWHCLTEFCWRNTCKILFFG